MFTNYSNYFFWLLLLCVTTSQAQILEAYVFDAVTKEPLFGVSVYFDGTTNGTSTNDEGKFRISYKPSTKSALIISYLGYEKQLLDVRKLTNGTSLYLVAKPQVLGTVYLENDTWSRKKKMDIFKREFIGRSVSATACRIVNQDDIELVYNPATQKLNAYASKPLIIKNKYLGYTVSYILEEFEADLRLSTMGDVLVRSVYVEGSSFYMEQNKEVRRKHRKIREKEYDQSVLYFMRSLAKKQLTENGFQIFHKGFIVPPYKYFEITNMGEDTKVNVTTNKLVIVYDRYYKSFLDIDDENRVFFINKFGNYSPPKKVFFGGVLGDKRVGNTLPLDYSL
ncbi:carboxypeptidase-like regulatory domain-containing protein [Kordia sp. YSTF-M3]|uniref:Carboxypeptidase-like regulatory domain-containing protein n=1 Tax=Kordia aestuariivivens TaxID=2759037 RepID=A0ABR7QFU0_9FLAO|nr:carboxypeptidase-like regulatory domain-containing protein [Kordia aestuariivivens]MBC8757442.1 carboxypeptidase-like regulatory domain-containing protein [Kordia aestuariivivens]